MSVMVALPGHWPYGSESVVGDDLSRSLGGKCVKDGWVVKHPDIKAGFWH